MQVLLCLRLLFHLESSSCLVISLVPGVAAGLGDWRLAKGEEGIEVGPGAEGKGQPLIEGAEAVGVEEGSGRSWELTEEACLELAWGLVLKLTLDQLVKLPEGLALTACSLTQNIRLAARRGSTPLLSHLCSKLLLQVVSQ